MRAETEITARLLFADEIAGGRVAVEDLDRRAVRRFARGRRLPLPARLAQALALKRGLLGYDRDVLEPTAKARRAVLGAAAPGPPRILVRVDEFPHAQAYDMPERYGTEQFLRFHSIMRDAGVPYLLAVTPRPCHAYLDPDATGDRAIDAAEREALLTACAEGVVPATHGLTHRTRFAKPRRHSELSGLAPSALAELLDRAAAELAAAGVVPRVFVPPFNRFDAAQYDELARRFAVVCSGPETVPELGFQRPPQWRGGALYLPSYPPLYGTAAQVASAVTALVERDVAAWVPLTLHLGWEADRGWTDLERLAELIAPLTRSWDDLLATAGQASSASAARSDATTRS